MYNLYYIIWDAVRWLLLLTLPGRTPARTSSRTFKCTFKWVYFEVVPQVRLVMWPRRSHSSPRRTHRLAWNPVQSFKGYLASSFQTFQIISILIIYCTSCLTYILIIEGNPSVNPPMKRPPLVPEVAVIILFHVKT